MYVWEMEALDGLSVYTFNIEASRISQHVDALLNQFDAAKSAGNAGKMQTIRGDLREAVDEAYRLGEAAEKAVSIRDGLGREFSGRIANRVRGYL